MDELECSYREMYARNIFPEFVKKYAMAVHRSIDGFGMTDRERIGCKQIDAFIIEHAEEISKRMQDEFIADVLGS